MSLVSSPDRPSTLQGGSGNETSMSLVENRSKLILGYIATLSVLPAFNGLHHEEGLWKLLTNESDHCCAIQWRLKLQYGHSGSHFSMVVRECHPEDDH